MDSETILETVRQGVARQGFMQTLGAELCDVSAGRCEMMVPFGSHVAQQNGLFHGGVVAAIADNAAAVAAYTLMEEGRQPLTIEFKINLLSPARGGAIIARADVLRAGRSITHAKTDVFIRSGDTEELCATALVTVKSTRAVQVV